MSYPPERHQGTKGESSAWAKPAGQTPDVSYANGGTVRYLAIGAETGGLFGLYEWNMSSEPSGANPHYHRTISESFYVLTGSVRIFDGKEWLTSQPGDYVHVPPGGIHGFRNESGSPASMLLLFAPGAPREPYFEGLVDLATMKPDERLRFAIKHDNHWSDL